MHKPSRPKSVLVYRILNAVAFAVVLVVNGLSTTGLIGRTNANISDSYPNSFVPAGWAFSIWGPIYLWLSAFCIYTAVLPKHTEAADLVAAIGPLFIISCAFNVAWVFTFSFGTPVALLVSTFWLFGILCSLLAVIIRINSWRAVRSSLWDFWIVDIAFSMYAGWCTVAAIANVVLTLKWYGGWTGYPWTESGWSALMISVAGAINIGTLASRTDAVFGLVFSWAALAIADGHREEIEVVISALVNAGIVGVGALGVMVFHIVRWAKRLRTRTKNVIVSTTTTSVVDAEAVKHDTVTDSIL